MRTEHPVSGSAGFLDSQIPEQVDGTVQVCSCGLMRISGYFPHSFLQHMRYGGFRPVVFLGHGLTVALFAVTTLVAAAALWRMNVPLRLTLGCQRLRLPPSGVMAYLGVVLVLCKSLASLLYGALAGASQSKGG